MKSKNYASKEWSDLEQPPTLSENKRWFGVHRGIRFEINNFKGFSGFKESWTHYIYISIDDQIPDKFKEKFWLKPEYFKTSEQGREHLSYPYYESIIRDLEFHGGCTWYSKESCEDDKSRVIKIGCDYQHLWDEGHDYNLHSVYLEVKETIESLWTRVGKIKIRSSGDGKYRYLEEFE